MKFQVQYTSVDGSGFLVPKGKTYPLVPPLEWTKREDAQRVADQHQREADKDGNPWGYRYTVREAGRRV